MSWNSLPSERAAIVGMIDPDAYAAADHSSGWIKADKFERYMAIVTAGTLGASATVDAKLEQAYAAAGTGVKDVTGKAITQLTQAGTDESDLQAIINLRGDELDLDGGFFWFRLTVTVGAANSDAGAIIVGFDPKYGPASLNDAASVAQIVA